MININIKNSTNADVTLYDVIGTVVRGFESMLPKSYHLSNVKEFLQNKYDLSLLKENINLTVENKKLSNYEIGFAIEKSYLMVIEKAIQNEINNTYDKNLSLNDIRGYLGTWGVVTELNLSEVIDKANHLLVAFDVQTLNKKDYFKVA